MILLAGLVGFLSGVGVNALADSLPLTRAARTPHCGACGAPRPWPVWSGAVAALARSSRCPYCGAAQDPRRPIIEIVAAVWSVLLSILLPGPRLFWPSFVLSAILLLVIVIDLEHRLILHVVTVPAAVVMGLWGSLDLSRGPVKTALGGAVGFLVVLGLFLLGGLFARLMLRLRGQTLDEVAFGFGDVTLAGVIGLAVGFPGIVVALTIGVLAGGIFSLGYLVVMIARGRYVAFTPIPYSPFLVLGALVVFIGARSGLFS